MYKRQLQNGLGNEEVVKKLVPEDRVMYGCGNMGTELPEPGVCVAKPYMTLSLSLIHICPF